MLTSFPRRGILSAIVAGAAGYLLKQIRARDLVAALETVGRGKSLLDPAVTDGSSRGSGGSQPATRTMSCRL